MQKAGERKEHSKRGSWRGCRGDVVDLDDHKLPYISDVESPCPDLLSAVRHVKPTVLIGLSAKKPPFAFTQQARRGWGVPAPLGGVRSGGRARGSQALLRLLVILVARLFASSLRRRQGVENYIMREVVSSQGSYQSAPLYPSLVYAFCGCRCARRWQPAAPALSSSPSP